jgi:hypothetical protein
MYVNKGFFLFFGWIANEATSQKNIKNTWQILTSLVAASPLFRYEFPKKIEKFQTFKELLNSQL